jgi:hypothetical protein
MNTKVVQLIKIYNFYMGHLFIWLNLNFSNFKIFKNGTFEPKFEIQSDLNLKCDEYQSFSTNEDLQLWYRSSWHLTKFEPFKFKFFKNGRFDPKFETQNDLNMKRDEYHSCSTNEDLQLWYLSFLHLKKFEPFKFEILKNGTFDPKFET